MKLLIGYDGSEAADAAVEDLSRGLARQRRGTDLAASDVWPQTEPALGPSTVASVMATSWRATPDR